MKQLTTYSIGIGDRFEHQGKAQLTALQQAQKLGITVVPVWNKSFREHQIIGSHPRNTRKEADESVNALGWDADYFVDADHINRSNVDLFLDFCDFFTIDVAEFIGTSANEEAIRAFVNDNRKYIGKLKLPNLTIALDVSEEQVRSAAQKYLFAIQEAEKIYRHIAQRKKSASFIVEISMDETDTPQTPSELFFILAALAQVQIPLQTIAPKFSGRFNKGVDYVGDLARFEKEFEQDVAVLQMAVEEFGLPANLKLSIHSGSDKFSIYPIMRRVIRKFNTGLHLKTAGTTWLEELIGLAEAGGEALHIAKEIYRESLKNIEALCKPYSSVIDIDRTQLPSFGDVEKWDGKKFAATLRHEKGNPEYNPHFRQLLHVGYKVAANMGRRFTDALEKYEAAIAPHVTRNIFEKHLHPLFLADE